jgi:hypothetical protein
MVEVTDIRQRLSDLPDDYISDEQIEGDIEDATAYVNALADVPDSPIEDAIRALAVYYTYMNYMSMAERSLGNIPSAADVKLAALRRRALGFLKLITTRPLLDNLTVDTEFDRRLTGMGMELYSVID